VSAAYVLEVFGTGEFLFKSVQLPKWAVMAVMPLGLALLALQFLRRALRPPPAAASAGL
jgi:TRAP-type mannitol/chloroaromatic compound transport system permease small subunit